MSHIIAEKFAGNRSRGWLGVSKELKEFVAQPKTHVWDCSDATPAKIDANTIGRVTENSLLVRCYSDSFSVSLRWFVFSRDGVEVGLEVDAVGTISHAESFLRTQRTFVDAVGQITASDIANNIVGETKTALLDEIARHPFTALTQDEALPLAWWLAFLNRHSQKIGITLAQVSRVSYRNAAKETRRELDKERERLQNALEHQRLLSDYHQSQETLKLNEAAKVREIKSNHQFTQEQQAEALKLMQLQSQCEQEKLRQDVLVARIKYERDRLALESEIAEIQNRPEEKRKLEDERRTQEERLQRYRDESLERLSAMEATQQAVHLAVSEGFVSLGDKLDSLINLWLGKFAQSGWRYDTPMTSEQLRCSFQQLACECREVPIKVLRATSRDIGCHRLDTLKIGETLAFEFVSPIGGFATVINLGTSGRFWLHIPNAYRTASQAAAVASRKYSVPGELLPRDELQRYRLDYYEQGPAGWEELIVLVTPKPLINEADLFKTESHNPFPLISNRRLQELLESLADFQPNEIAIGSLGFVVCE